MSLKTLQSNSRYAGSASQRAPAALNHARAAIKAGATKEQLHAAASMAFVFGGLGPLNLSGEVINKAFEE